MAEERTAGRASRRTAPNRTTRTSRRRSWRSCGTGWRDTELPVEPRPEVPNYAKRRAALSAAFPGETLVIPTGAEKVRANDTDYPFRPGSDFAYLTGDHDPDSVLVLRPNGSGPRRHALHAAPLVRARPTSSSAAAHGELWVGRRHTLAREVRPSWACRPPT